MNDLLPLLLKIDNGVVTQLMVSYFQAALNQDKHDHVFEFFSEAFETLDLDNLYTARLLFLRSICETTVGMNLFLDVFYKYDKDIQERFLYQIKMNLESIISLSMYGDFKHEWEIEQYKSIENPYTVTALISCLHCRAKYPNQTGLLSLLGIEDILGASSMPETQNIIDIEFHCKKCGSNIGSYPELFDLLDMYYLIDRTLRQIVDLL